MQQISATQLAGRISDPGRDRPVLLDVREPWEYERCHVAGAKHVPMRLVPLRIGELDAEKEIVVICHHGGRSMQVAMFLERAGFSSVHNLMGGIDAWARDVDPAMARY
ncbi:MAG: Rhodanese-like protein [Rhodocyclaceae bacterium]|nr:Rhodanese-like protein [Rhodocyclaceae bacterium]